MFTLKYQVPDQAIGGVAAVYAHFQGRGPVPAPLQLLSASPALLDVQFNQIKYFMGHERLTFPLLAAIRLLAARQVCYEHCQLLNRGWLEKSGLSSEDIDNLLDGRAVEAFSEAENALLRCVAKVLRKERVGESEVSQLRDLGWTDADILDASAQGTGLIASSYLFEAFRK